MPASHRDSDDMDRSLLSISEGHSSKITSQLVDIQSAQLPQQKSFDFLERLKCLYFPNTHKRKFNTIDAEDKTSRDLSCRRIDAFDDESPEYVALSYTWRPSHFEIDLSVGGYRVQQTNFSQPEQSEVRDSVFRRTRAYMDYVSVRYLWIDQHCIEQEKGDEKEVGMNAMDRVYSLSSHPVALLYRPIKTLVELNLLIEILTGKLVEESCGRFQLSKRGSQDRALRAIELLKDITSDLWFSRGWTFQENYRAGTGMILLMPSSPGLNKSKPCKLLGYLDGELCIRSVLFHEGVTKLCLAYQSSQPLCTTPCHEILARASKYTILLQDKQKSAPKSMTPTIISNLGARRLLKNWDLLPIAANCCQYSVRLDSTKLEKKHSLSLSILVLCLLNGEILWNYPQDGHNVAAAKDLNIVEYLEKQFFDGLRSPSPSKSLTFNKGCRFDQVKLTEEGIQTRGHLWRLESLILADSVPDSSYQDEMASSKSSDDNELWRLRDLADKLYSWGEESLSIRLHELMDKIGARQTFAEKWQHSMAIAIATAIGQRKTLCTACPVKSPIPGNAIFIVEPAEESGTSVSPLSSSNMTSGTAMHNLEEPTYVFTSFCPGKDFSGKYDSNDIEKHVSMEVESPDLEGGCSLPRLFTKRWMKGLCFFEGYPRQNVVFPWPASIQNL